MKESMHSKAIMQWRTPRKGSFMSMSEMSRSTYKAHNQSIRANGLRHALKWIDCPLEKADMVFLENQEYDHLLQRVAFQKLSGDTPSIAFLLTTPFKG